MYRRLKIVKNRYFPNQSQSHAKLQLHFLWKVDKIYPKMYIEKWKPRIEIDLETE